MPSTILVSIASTFSTSSSLSTRSSASRIPLEAWTKEVNAGNASVEDYFILKNLAARIDELVAEKSA